MRRSERACGKKNRASCFGTVLGHTQTEDYTAILIILSSVPP